MKTNIAIIDSQSKPGSQEASHEARKLKHITMIINFFFIEMKERLLYSLGNYNNVCAWGAFIKQFQSESGT